MTIKLELAIKSAQMAANMHKQDAVVVTWNADYKPKELCVLLARHVNGKLMTVVQTVSPKS